MRGQGLLCEECAQAHEEVYLEKIEGGVAVYGLPCLKRLEHECDRMPKARIRKAMAACAETNAIRRRWLAERAQVCGVNFD